MLRPYIVRSRAVSIAGGGPVYTSMSALPDRDRSGQARVDEPALVARALAGDREALGTRVPVYAGSGRRVTRVILGNVDDAEDAAQDGVLAALVKLDQYDPSRPFGPWLLRIAANAAIDRRRRRTVRDAGVLGDDVAAKGPLPDVETERVALGERLRAALDELPEHYRLARGAGALEPGGDCGGGRAGVRGWLPRRPRTRRRYLVRRGVGDVRYGE